MKTCTARCAAIAGLACLLTAASAEASNADYGYIGQTIVMPNGEVLFTTTGARSGLPACATVARRWAFSASTLAGQARLASLLAASKAGKQVGVAGTGDCSVWGDTETASYFYTADAQ